MTLVPEMGLRLGVNVTVSLNFLEFKSYFHATTKLRQFMDPGPSPVTDMTDFFFFAYFNSIFQLPLL